MGRHETLERVRRKEISVTDAAKLEGVSRTRINQLLKSKAKKETEKPAPAAAAAPTIRIVNPGPAPAAAPPPAAGQVEAPPVAPVDLKSVLDPVAPAAAAAPTVTVGPIPTDSEGKPIDPDDVDAGRELLGWIRRGAADLFAKWVCKVAPDDPRLEKLKEENKFLKVAFKRNSDKAAPLGWFTRGWLGLIIGLGIEAIRVTTTFPPTKGPKPPPPPTPKPADDVPTAPPTQTVEEVRDQAEGRTRLTIEERLRIYNEGQ